MFDCDACELRQRAEGLDQVNLEAWGIYSTLGSRVVQDWGLMPYTLDALTDGWSGEDRVDLLARLDLMRELLTPVPADG